MLGANDPECLDREMVKMECLNSRLIPPQLWGEWKRCEKVAGTDGYDLCRDELDEYVILLCHWSKLTFLLASA